MTMPPAGVPAPLPDLRDEGLHAFLLAFHDDVERDPLLAPWFRGLDMAAHVEEVIAARGLADRRSQILDFWGRIEPLPQTRDLVTAVRAAGVPCYLATNQDNLRASYMRRLLGYDELLDGTYYSCEVGAAKPEAPLEAAAEALAAFGVAAEDAASAADGPGTFHARLYDALYALEPDTLDARTRIAEA